MGNDPPQFPGTYVVALWVNRFRQSGRRGDRRWLLLRSHAGHCFRVFVDYSNKILFFSAEAILLPIYFAVVRNTPSGKRHISRTKPVYSKHNDLDQSLHSPQSFLHRCQISLMHSSTRKQPQKRTRKVLLRHLLVNLKNRRSSGATDVVWNWTLATTTTTHISTG